MKPLGPIPRGYGAVDGVLAVDGIPVTDLIASAGGTPLFVYSTGLIRARLAELRTAMPERLAIHYAMKANPYIPVLRLFSELVDGFDIASGGELAMVREAGIDCTRVSFAGPGKRDEELGEAIRAGVR